MPKSVPTVCLFSPHRHQNSSDSFFVFDGSAFFVGRALCTPNEAQQRGRVGILLANAHHLKNVPGRETDIKDCQWIAQLLQHGFLKGSFIPPRAARVA